MNSLKTPPAEAQHKGIRLDKYLSACFPDISRSRLHTLIEQGYVEQTNNAGLKIKEGMIFTLTLPDAEEAVPLPQEIPLDILYEDEDIIVVNKPAGMVVHPGAGTKDSTLVNALLAHCKGSLSGIGGVKRPGIVHRIDKETSGILVAAKNDKAHQKLSEQFAVHSIQRTYQAFVWGRMIPLEGKIEGAIGRSTQDRQKMAIVPNGKPAVTHYKTKEIFKDGLASFMEFRLETGRTHQIRVHMSTKKHSLIGDKLYGQTFKSAPSFLRTFPRQALHAFSLGFIHPSNGKELYFETPMPQDMRELYLFLKDLSETAGDF